MRTRKPSDFCGSKIQISQTHPLSNTDEHAWLRFSATNILFIDLSIQLCLNLNIGYLWEFRYNWLSGFVKLKLVLAFSIAEKYTNVKRKNTFMETRFISDLRFTSFYGLLSFLMQQLLPLPESRSRVGIYCPLCRWTSNKAWLMAKHSPW